MSLDENSSLNQIKKGGDNFWVGFLPHTSNIAARSLAEK